MREKEIRVPSVIPIYGIGVTIILYSLIFPMYKISHLLIEAVVCLLVYFLLKKLFPGKAYTVDEAVTTGDEKIDALLKEGTAAVGEMEKLRKSIKNEAICQKIDDIADITKKIFEDLLEDPADYRQIKRFADYFLPTTIKLLHSYDRFAADELSGDNAKDSMARIESVLDETLKAYHNQYDALFSNQALDIETDIEVLKTMLKREGLADKDF